MVVSSPSHLGRRRLSARGAVDSRRSGGEPHRAPVRSRHDEDRGDHGLRRVSRTLQGPDSGFRVISKKVYGPFSSCYTYAVTTRRRVLMALPLVAAALLSSSLAVSAAGRLPSRLSDSEFWTLIGDLSEPGGAFRSDNLLSNESRFQFVIPDLVDTARPGGVYMGVGPEQNFTYIAAVRPAMAFIVDIRRANLDLHLMYKALFELSADRADFVSRLFSRKRPEGLTAASSVRDIFQACASV